MDKRTTLLLISLIVFCLALSACGKAADPPSLTSQCSTSTPGPTRQTTPIPPTAPSEFTWRLTPRPTEMESYGLVYDLKATPRIPPLYSVDMSIWGNEIPTKLISGAPQFLDALPPESQADTSFLVEAAGCEVSKHGYVECPAESPLAPFGCEYIHISIGVNSSSGIDGQYAGTCYTPYLDKDQPREEYLFRGGCAFRRNASHIFKVGEEYQLISTPEELWAFFGLIESPEEALTFAQLITGLPAQLSFEYDETLLYFQESITGTQVREVEEGYILNLFHFQNCMCEPWISSQVLLQVSRDGEITWLETIPLWMTTGFGCAD